jgi:hypothetical protein
MRISSVSQQNRLSDFKNEMSGSYGGEDVSGSLLGRDNVRTMQISINVTEEYTASYLKTNSQLSLCLPVII